jgi:hypothetical protein
MALEVFEVYAKKDAAAEVGDPGMNDINRAKKSWGVDVVF